MLNGLLATGGLQAVEIIAHRGASHDAPENTRAAMILGFEQGAEAGEVDVHLSSDGRIVVHHDFDTARSAGLARPLVEQSFEELRTLEVGQWGRWQGSRFSEKIPLLSEILSLVPAGRRLFIEIKVKETILPELTRVIAASGLPASQLPLITFDLAVAKATKQQLPEHVVCWIVGYAADKTTGQFPAIEDQIREAKAAGLDGLDLNSKFPIDAAFVAQVHAAGLKLYTWTVDDPLVAAAQRAAGVDGITTNRPGWLREQFSAL